MVAAVVRRQEADRMGRVARDAVELVARKDPVVGFAFLLLMSI
jgi:hypothetical protein